MFSYFVLMTFDDWYNAFIDPVLYESPMMVVVFIFFLMVTSFSILNILCALVVSSTLETATEQMHVDGESDEAKRRERLATIENIFSAMAQKDAGEQDASEHRMSLEEFESFAEKPDVRNELSEIGIDPEDIHRLFDVLDVDGSGYLELSELVQGVDRLCDRAVGRDINIAQQDLSSHILATEQQFQAEIEAENERWEMGCAKLEALEAAVEQLLQAVEKRNKNHENVGARADIASRLDRLSKHLGRSLMKDDAIKALGVQHQGTVEEKFSKSSETASTVHSTARSNAQVSEEPEGEFPVVCVTTYA